MVNILLLYTDVVAVPLVNYLIDGVEQACSSFLGLKALIEVGLIEILS